MKKKQFKNQSNSYECKFCKETNCTQSIEYFKMMYKVYAECYDDKNNYLLEIAYNLKEIEEEIINEERMKDGIKIMKIQEIIKKQIGEIAHRIINEEEEKELAEDFEYYINFYRKSFI